ncbi:hypothetical protein TREES_T100011925 [Tupaia chinensis]|uniref:Uncharacterized protein n=1 Tax=Tupaia chinensis TaxID=246437 RepID=L9KXT5_TUPCH|nr:hypothetical protein TREES_T100011925 [Tupaia chinensis]
MPGWPPHAAEGLPAGKAALVCSWRPSLSRLPGPLLPELRLSVTRCCLCSCGEPSQGAFPKCQRAMPRPTPCFLLGGSHPYQTRSRQSEGHLGPRCAEVCPVEVSAHTFSSGQRDTPTGHALLQPLRHRGLHGETAGLRDRLPSRVLPQRKPAESEEGQLSGPEDSRERKFRRRERTDGSSPEAYHPLGPTTPLTLLEAASSERSRQLGGTEGRVPGALPCPHLLCASALVEKWQLPASCSHVQSELYVCVHTFRHTRAARFCVSPFSVCQTNCLLLSALTALRWGTAVSPGISQDAGYCGNNNLASRWHEMTFDSHSHYTLTAVAGPLLCIGLTQCPATSQQEADVKLSLAGEVREGSVVAQK